MTVAAVVLAAGGGTRFAGPTHKLLVDVAGRPVVRWALDHARAAGLDETIVVMGAVDLRPLTSAGDIVLENPWWAAGQAGSLQVALRYARRAGHDAVVVGLGDQPLVPPITWRTIAATPEPLVSARLDGQRTPPVRIARELWPQLPAVGDEGARVLIRGRPDLVREVACPGRPIDLDTVDDLDSLTDPAVLEDLAQWSSTTTSK